MPKFFFVLFIGALLNHSWAQHPEIVSKEGWKFEKSKYDVEVYSKSIPGYEVKAFMATGLIDSDIQSVYKAVMDIESYSEWYPHCELGKVLEETDVEQMRRIVFKLPWPFDRRDAVNKLVTTYKSDSIWIEILNEADFLPEYKKTYRLQQTEGYWLLTSESDQQTRLTYSAIGEPGGIPKWIVNIFLFDAPLDAINNLREIARREHYTVTN